MKYIFIMITSFFVCVPAYGGPDENQSQNRCMTEYESSLYYDKLMAGYLKGNALGGLILEGELEKCIEAGSLFASYDLGTWEYFMALESLEKSKIFFKSKDYDVSDAFRKDALRNGHKAIGHLEQSAKSEYPWALYKLGEIYKDGLVISKSRIHAGKYLYPLDLQPVNLD